MQPNSEECWGCKRNKITVDEEVGLCRDCMSIDYEEDPSIYCSCCPPGTSCCAYPYSPEDCRA